MHPGGVLFISPNNFIGHGVPTCAWEGQTDDGMFIERNWLQFRLSSSVEDKCRTAMPKFQQRAPTRKFTHLIAGATRHQRLFGKQTVPPAERLSEPRSSSAGPELPASRTDAPRMPPEPLEEEIPLADPERHIETWIPLANMERDALENLSLREREREREKCVMHWCTDFTENWGTPTSVEWSTA